ncbi:hypothetical protein NPIL_346921 [Nephila pilipes]|uniref:Uncharacterized protein n=1 Tax=Nephila pilipes TaxID=299642 RepID=A0A8X6U7I9_NEPPI|nr:hypothetical protein NPIL_346921 [Nephila pilipes]
MSNVTEMTWFVLSPERNNLPTSASDHRTETTGCVFKVLLAQAIRIAHLTPSGRQKQRMSKFLPCANQETIIDLSEGNEPQK